MESEVEESVKFDPKFLSCKPVWIRNLLKNINMNKLYQIKLVIINILPENPLPRTMWGINVAEKYKVVISPVCGTNKRSVNDSYDDDDEEVITM